MSTLAWQVNSQLQLPFSLPQPQCTLSLIKNGGGVRLIAVGEVLRRLTSKLASSAVRHTAVEHLSPLQVGVGIKNGTEAIIHAVNNLLSNVENRRKRPP